MLNILSPVKICQAKEQTDYCMIFDKCLPTQFRNEYVLEIRTYFVCTYAYVNRGLLDMYLGFVKLICYSYQVQCGG